MSIPRRIETGLAPLTMHFVRSIVKNPENVDLYQFMPHETKPEEAEITLEEAMRTW